MLDIFVNERFKKKKHFLSRKKYPNSSPVLERRNVLGTNFFSYYRTPPCKLYENMKSFQMK